MQVVRLERSSRFDWPLPVLTVGNFDGVHRGHQALVAAAVEQARARSGTVVALTFDPHPVRVLDPSRAGSALMTLDQKAEVMAALGVARLVIVPFDGERAAQSPEEFAREVLAGALRACTVVVGTSFRFGRGRAGDATALARLGSGLAFQVIAVGPVEHEGTPISSTRIRLAVEEGRVDQARAMLGRRFFLDGSVVRGEGRGRTLGIPTANLDPVNETLPARGVYAAWCRALDGPAVAAWAAVVNIGRRPTFAGRDTTVEAHLLDVDQDLYGRRLRLEFVARLREEQPFPGPDALIEQIRRDIARSRPLLDADSGRKL